MPRIQHLSSGGINVTYRCPAACAHCLPASSPRRERAYITRETARDVLPRLRKRGVRELHIGGGEPFLDFEGLCMLIREMNAAGMAVDYIETNAFWAAGTVADEEKLRRLRELGAGVIMFSLCPYHAEFVPVQRVYNAVRAAEAVGMDYFVYQARFARELEALGAPDRVHPLQAYEARFPGGVDRLPERFGVRLCGRAALTHANLTPVPTRTLVERSKPCDLTARVQHFHVDVYGNYVPAGCNGIAVAIGDIDNIGAERYPAFTRICMGGVRGIVQDAVAAGFEPKDAYPGECALCQHARGWLALRDGENWPDLRPLDFYRELFPEIVGRGR